MDEVRGYVRNAFPIPIFQPEAYVARVFGAGMSALNALFAFRRGVAFSRMIRSSLHSILGRPPLVL